MVASAGRDLQNFIPPLKNHGILNLVGTNQRGLGMQFVAHTIAGGPALALTFDGLGLADMEDANYAIFAENNTTGAAVLVTAGTKTVAGFTLAAGPIAPNVVNIVVIGQIAGTPDPA